MIKLTGVVKRYRGRAVTPKPVEGLDQDNPEGKMVNLHGPAGCGTQNDRICYTRPGEPGKSPAAVCDCHRLLRAVAGRPSASPGPAGIESLRAAVLCLLTGRRAGDHWVLPVLLPGGARA